MKDFTKITLDNLPKISLNKYYAGVHWSDRKQAVDNFKWAVKSQAKIIYPKDRSYDVNYLFEFKSRPLDSSNCMGMVKIIEDTIFEDDNYKIIHKVSMRSIKSNRDRVTILIYLK